MEWQSGAWSRPALKAPLEPQLYFASLLQMRCQDVPAFCTVNLGDCPHCPKKERSHTGCALGCSHPPLLYSAGLAPVEKEQHSSRTWRSPILLVLRRQACRQAPLALAIASVPKGRANAYSTADTVLYFPAFTHYFIVTWRDHLHSAGRATP